MRIIHNIINNLDDHQHQFLVRLGVEIDPDEPVFLIEESHPHWLKVRGLIADWGLSDLVSTEFTKRELSMAHQLCLEPTWHYGYPQPEEDFGYLSLSYDLSDYCRECGMGLVQDNPFYMRGEPRWGRRGAMQLNWVFDEYFVRPEVWEHTFRPFGIEKRKVMRYKKGTELESVVQLRIDQVAESYLDIPETAPVITCDVCNRRKYLPWVRGPFPRFHTEVEEPIVKTPEYFGSGHSAWRAVIVSKDLYEKIRADNVKGLEFVPVAYD